MTIVIVEQNVPMVFRMTHRCVILEKGKMVAGGSSEELEVSEVTHEYPAV